jgi:formimidoylglutamate deiminase
VALFVSPAGTIARFADAPEDLKTAHRLRGRAIIPGLVNAHSHTFQRCIRARTEHRTPAVRDSFWSWREAMYHAANRLTPADIYDAARMAFLEMLLAGITSVGEFHYLHHAPDGARYHDPNLLGREIIRGAEETGIRIALLNVAYVRAGWRRPPDPLQARFITADVQQFLRDTEALRESVSVRVGVAPHSVRAVPLPYLLEVVQYAHTHAIPLHMHVSEQPAELEACVAEYGVTPVELLREHGVLDRAFTAVHATHTTPKEIKHLSQAGASICACPTTERNLGDGMAAGDEWKAAGINVCFGSDSNIQIDLLEDARELEYHLRLQRLERAVLADQQDTGSLARYLLDCATRNGAQSLVLPCGELAVGQPADFFTIDLNDPSLVGAEEDSLLSHVIFAAQRTAVRDVFVAGRRVIEDGRHAQQHSILERFGALQRTLWS